MFIESGVQNFIIVLLLLLLFSIGPSGLTLRVSLRHQPEKVIAQCV